MGKIKASKEIAIEFLDTNNTNALIRQVKLLMMKECESKLMEIAVDNLKKCNKTIICDMEFESHYDVSKRCKVICFIMTYQTEHINKDIRIFNEELDFYEANDTDDDIGYEESIRRNKFDSSKLKKNMKIIKVKKDDDDIEYDNFFDKDDDDNDFEEKNEDEDDENNERHMENLNGNFSTFGIDLVESSNIEYLHENYFGADTGAGAYIGAGFGIDIDKNIHKNSSGLSKISSIITDAENGDVLVKLSDCDIKISVLVEEFRDILMNMLEKMELDCCSRDEVFYCIRKMAESREISANIDFYK